MGVHTLSADAVRAELEEIEELGYSAVWFPERLGTTREALSTAAMLLGWSKKLVVGTGIANVYARDPATAMAGARSLSEAYPGRFILGLGVGHRSKVERHGLTYDAPVPAMSAYLDGMEAAGWDGPSAGDVAIVLAALGPKMLDLARERSRGAHPHLSTPEHTALARERLGAGRLLAPEQAVVLERDGTRARELAREHAAKYIGLKHYQNHLWRLGFGDEDMAGGGNDRLAAALVAHGTVDRVVERVRAHFDAGADHVCVQIINGEAGTGLAALRELAPALVPMAAAGSC